jgi:glycosyltransferase involved in cell wall biosynthesis
MGGRMRILMVHNRYLQRGGEDVSTVTEMGLLRDAGHEVVLLEESNERVAELGRIATAARTVWSREGRSKVRHALDDGRFDVMHVQNFFPLFSPSIYGAARKAGVAVVQSLRNFRLICPAATLYRDGAVCELCVGRRVAIPGVRYACYRDSRAATAVVATMSATHTMGGTFARGVDLFVTPSDFARDKLGEGGWDTSRIVVKPNSVHPDPGPGPGGRDVLFVGRLDQVKGVRTLLDAWRESSLDVSLLIAGDGPEMPVVESAAADDSRIRVLGRLSPSQTYTLMGRAAFVVVPSLWYETFGRVVVEAYATGTPVVVSSLGALPELVNEGVTGLIVEPGDAAVLRGAMERMVETAPAMRPAARMTFEARFAGPSNVAALESVYRRAIASKERADAQ